MPVRVLGVPAGTGTGRAKHPAPKSLRAPTKLSSDAETRVHAPTKLSSDAGARARVPARLGVGHVTCAGAPSKLGAGARRWRGGPPRAGVGLPAPERPTGGPRPSPFPDSACPPAVLPPSRAAGRAHSPHALRPPVPSPSSPRLPPLPPKATIVSRASRTVSDVAKSCRRFLNVLSGDRTFSSTKRGPRGEGARICAAGGAPARNVLRQARSCRLATWRRPRSTARTSCGDSSRTRWVRRAWTR